MPHELGSVTLAREARVQVRFANGEAHECLVDTGFDGALILPRTLVARLQLPIIGQLVIQTVGGARSTAELALAEVVWLAETRTFEVIVSTHDDSLIGTEMLIGARLVIDYVAGTVEISK